MTTPTNKIRSTIAAALLAASAQATADTYLHTGAWSQHFSDRTYNESHNLLAVDYKSYVVGYFENSYGEDSFIAAKRWSWQYGNWEAGVSAGAVYGYRHCLKGWTDRNRRTCPLIAPSITYTKYTVQPSLLVMGNAVAVSIRTDLSSLFGDAK